MNSPLDHLNQPSSAGAGTLLARSSSNAFPFLFGDPGGSSGCSPFPPRRRGQGGGGAAPSPLSAAGAGAGRSGAVAAQSGRGLGRGGSSGAMAADVFMRPARLLGAAGPLSPRTEPDEDSSDTDDGGTSPGGGRRCGPRRGQPPGPQIIHSGHFMVSSPHSEHPPKKGYDFDTVNEQTCQTYQFGAARGGGGAGGRLSIDASLTKLFECMSLAYRYRRGPSGAGGESRLPGEPRPGWARAPRRARGRVRDGGAAERGPPPGPTRPTRGGSVPLLFSANLGILAGASPRAWGRGWGERGLSLPPGLRAEGWGPARPGRLLVPLETLSIPRPGWERVQASGAKQKPLKGKVPRSMWNPASFPSSPPQILFL